MIHSADTLEKDQEFWREQLLGELLLFSMLGRNLYAFPQVDWLDPLADGNLFDDVPFAADRPETNAGLQLLREWQQEYVADRPAGLLELRKEHTRLLTGSGDLPLSPWESVYFSEDRMLFDERTLEVRRWYRRFGLEPINVRREPDDHIGLELSFMAHLAQLGLEALESGNQTYFEETIAAQRLFAQQHLFAWVPRWCRQMGEFAHSSFYRGLALVLSGGLNELADLLDLPIVEKQ
jgi:TorA maturation chaperone TorD